MGKVLAGFFAALFVVAAVFILLLISVDGVLLNPETYKRALVEQKIYERAPALIAEQLAGSSSIPGLGGQQMAYLSLLAPADWNVLVAALLPAADLQKLSEDGLDQVFRYLDGNSDSVAVSLVELKQHLAGSAGQEAIRAVLAAQPPCTLEQLSQVATSVIGGSGALIKCKPPAEVLDVAVSMVHTSMRAAVALIPDEIEILNSASSSFPATGAGPLGSDPRATIRAVRVGARFGPLLPLGLLLLVAACDVRSLQGWLRWWGIPILFAGLVAMGMALAAGPIVDWIWANYIAVKIPALLSPSITTIAHDLLDSVARQLGSSIMLEAGVVGLLGLAATAASFFADRKSPGPIYPRR